MERTGHVIVGGGGLTGAAAALQLARARPALAITVIEPRAELGRGMAYTAPDPDHCLNAAPEGHTLDPDDPGDLPRWIEAAGVLASDPESVADNGVVYVRRHVPTFVRAAGSPPSVRALLRALRRRIVEVEAAGGEWQTAFDELRDVVWRVWPAIAPADKRRLLRWLRDWYDVHRFRAPPQNVALVSAAERQGIVRYRVLRIASAEVVGGSIAVDGEPYDAIVNCTGLDPSAGIADNPLLGALLERGILSRDASGVGFSVDAECRPVGRDGMARQRLRVLGPPTAGTFGDPLGAPFIVPQVRRALPGMLAVLDRAPMPCP